MAADHAAGLLVSHSSRVFAYRLTRGSVRRMLPLSRRCRKDTPSACFRCMRSAFPFGALRARSDAPSPTTCCSVFDRWVRHLTSTRPRPATRRPSDPRLPAAQNLRRFAAHVTNTSKIPHARVAPGPRPWPPPHGAKLLRDRCRQNARIRASDTARRPHWSARPSARLPEHQVVVPKGWRTSHGARDICRRGIGLSLDHALSRVAGRRGGSVVGSGSRFYASTRRCDGARLDRDLPRHQRDTAVDADGAPT